MKVVNLSIKMLKKSDKNFSQKRNVVIKPTETTTVVDIKNSVKDQLGFPFEIESEEFWYMSRQLKNDTDIVPNMSGNEYIITFK
jgi:hypothetical protein